MLEMATSTGAGSMTTPSSARGTSPISTGSPSSPNDGPYMRAVLAMNGLMPARLRVFGLSEIAAAEDWLMDGGN